MSAFDPKRTCIGPNLSTGPLSYLPRPQIRGVYSVTAALKNGTCRIPFRKRERRLSHRRAFHSLVHDVFFADAKELVRSRARTFSMGEFAMKRKFLIIAASLISMVLSTSVWSQQDERLGKVSFPTSCDPKVQTEFERGVAMLHSYWFLYARKTFEGVLKQDPNCAIAYWGLALDLLGNSLTAPPSRTDAQAAWEALEKARAIGAKTARERDWIEALSAYYRDYDKVALNSRLLAYNNAMEQLTQRYPDDYEAQVFYALTLQASASPTDTTYANQLKSAAILEKLYEQNPRHPGVSHFLIHAYDYPPLAEKGIAAARRYAGIAPAVPHARHM